MLLHRPPVARPTPVSVVVRGVAVTRHTAAEEAPTEEGTGASPTRRRPQHPRLSISPLFFYPPPFATDTIFHFLFFSPLRKLARITDPGLERAALGKEGTKLGVGLLEIVVDEDQVPESLFVAVLHLLLRRLQAEYPLGGILGNASGGGCNGKQ
jgi:hypothetical protein